LIDGHGLDNIDNITHPYFSVTHEADRERVMKNVETGRTKFVIATMTGNIGLNFQGLVGVVTLELMDLVETYSQWFGRVSRDGSGGWSIICIPETLQIPT
jgi:superfamily II DNA/RNA helicase